MTKELVEEAMGKPQKDREVIKEARELFDKIEERKKRLKNLEGEIESVKKTIKISKFKLDLLRQGKYTISKSQWNNSGYTIDYPKEKEEAKG